MVWPQWIAPNLLLSTLSLNTTVFLLVSLLMFWTRTCAHYPRLSDEIVAVPTRLILSSAFSLWLFWIPTAGYEVFLWPLEHFYLSCGILIIFLARVLWLLFTIRLNVPWWHGLSQHQAHRQPSALCSKCLMLKTNLPSHASLSLLNYLLA